MKESEGKKMTQLQQLKEEFTRLSGLPAKKAFVEAVCVGAGFRNMRSKADWEWAVSAIAPKFRSDIYESKIASLEAELAQAQSAPLEVAVSAQPVFNSIEDVAYVLGDDDAAVFFQFLFAISDNLKSTYRALSRKFHPDLNPNNPRSHSLSVILNITYEQQNHANNQQNEYKWEEHVEYDADGFMHF